MRFFWLACCTVSLACAGGEVDPPPQFLQTGVIEGFYGPPWSHQDRLDVIAFMGSVGLTHYYYAPKDDPFHRSRWRDPYPTAAWEQLQALVRAAQDTGVTFVFAISPGGSITYGDSADYAALEAKLLQVRTLGVRDFALFLDDVPQTLRAPSDRQQFGRLAAAHAALINRLAQDLDTLGTTLVVTPTVYTAAWGSHAYLEELGDAVTADVPFFWTGADVVSRSVTVDDAREWAGLIGRAPLLWDNYPVNDFARWRLFLGPVQGRDTDLARVTDGIVANPMNEAHASMISLATLAEYVRAPAAYDPDEALARAVDALYGERGSRLLEPFLTVYGDYWWEENVFDPLFIPGAAIDVPRTEAALERLTQALRQLGPAVTSLPALRPLIDEIRPFVSQSTDRLAEILQDPRYQLQGSRLAFRDELNNVSARVGAPRSVDGNISEWSDATWLPLVGTSDRSVPSVAFAADTARVYVAVRIPGRPGAAYTVDRIGDGDHVALVVARGAVPRNSLTPEDVVVLVAPPARGAPTAIRSRSLDVSGFMAKFLADNQNLLFSEFLVSSLGKGAAMSVAAGAQQDSTGWTVEFSIPREGKNELRLNVSVTSSGSGTRRAYRLAQLNYPANPATFNKVIIGGVARPE
jgi:hypothetical protein